jgi:hypothetical protein
MIRSTPQTELLERVPMTEGFGAGVRLTRTQTIMQGADRCDFRYSLHAQDPET